MQMFFYILACSLNAAFFISISYLLVRLVVALFSIQIESQPWPNEYRFVLSVILCLLIVLIPICAPFLAGVPGGITAAREAKTANEMVQIQTALLNYKTEYGHFPSKMDTSTLIQNLQGMNQSDNPRGIAFLNLKQSDLSAKGEPLDAWGIRLRISQADTAHPVIQSAGPDLRWNTADDMTNEK